MIPAIIRILADLPDKPGVYVLKDNEDRVIYVSKTLNIKQRVKSHLANKDSRKDTLIQKHLKDVDWFVIEDGYEAASVELQLIKQHHPPLNGRRKDEKQYRFIRLSTSEKFARARVIKLNEPKGQEILGPFPRSRHVKRVFSWAVNYFEIADCGKKIILGDDSVTVQTCLRRKIKQCLRPCEVPIDENIYEQRVESFKRFFRGESTEMIDDLDRQMKECVQTQEFERAAQFRNQIQAIKRVIRFGTD